MVSGVRLVYFPHTVSAILAFSSLWITLFEYSKFLLYPTDRIFFLKLCKISIYNYFGESKIIKIDTLPSKDRVTTAHSWYRGVAVLNPVLPHLREITATSLNNEKIKIILFIFTSMV
jgi:hypothetical protein